MNNAKKNTIIGIIAFSVVLVTSFFVNCILGLSGFESVYKDALMSRYSIQGELVKNRIEASLNLGKKLYMLDSQIDPLFYSVMRETPGIESFYVADNTETVLYSTRTVLNQRKIPFRYYNGKQPVDSEQNFYTEKFLDSWFVCIPLFTDNNFAGSLYIEVAQKTIAASISMWSKNVIKYACLIFLAAVLIYVILMLCIGNIKKIGNIIIILMLLVSQGVFSVLSYRLYNNAITHIFNINITVLSKSISNSIEPPVTISGGFENLDGIDEYLQKRLEGNVYCAGIFITDTDMNVIYSAEPAEKQSVINSANQNYVITKLLKGTENESNLVLSINRRFINGILRDMAIDSGVIILVALIFAFILKDLFALMTQKKDLEIEADKMNAEESKTALRLIKISTFIFMFAAFETLSFIPLYIQHVYAQSALNGISFNWISEDMLISLPVGSYMLGIMISMFITLFAIKKLSIRTRYMLMSAVFIAGSFLTMCSSNIIIFMIARLIAGFGFGGVLLSTSSLVIQYTSEKNRSAGFGTNAAAFAAASIASIPIGGVIVNKFGYEAGIMVSIIFAAVFLLFSIFCVPEGKKQETAENKEASVINGRQFIKVLFSKHILLYILCINIPFQLIYWGLFQFILPIYMNETLHLSQSNIGVILGVFSAVSLGAAFVGKAADKVRNDKLLIAAGSILAGISLILFGSIHGGILMFLAAMIAMGIDNLFIDSIEEVYLETGNIKNLSGENILQSYKVIEKVLSVFIPTATGMILASLGFNLSILGIGIYSLAGAVLFIIFGKNNRWEKHDDIK